MSEQAAYPLSWPVGWKRTGFRTCSRFGHGGNRPSTGKGTRLVLDELKRMGVADYQVVISTNLKLRLDGLPYSNQANPQDPGAAVYWRKGDKKFVIACDRWTSIGENLYTIGRTIEATRAIERWGAVTTEQAFAGYIALNEKTEATCWEVLGIHIDATESTIMDAYRRRARETHPDHGGTPEAFSAVVRAKEIALGMRRK